MPFPLIGAIASGVVKLGGALLPFLGDKNKKQEFEATIQKELLDFAQKQEESYQAELTAQTSIILAETTGELWIQKAWRPVLMLTFVAILQFNYIWGPIFDLPVRELHDRAWTLLIVGVGGYVGGRTLEKRGKDWIDAWKGNGHA